MENNKRKCGDKMKRIKDDGRRGEDLTCAGERREGGRGGTVSS